VALAGATQAVYALGSATATASGRYTLVVSNGLGSATSVPVDVQVGPVGTVTGGSLLSWGSNVNGQVGDGKGIGRATFVPVDKTGVLAGKTVVQVAAGASHSLALTSDGKIFAWGLNSSGQLGNTVSGASTVPVAVNQLGVLAGKTVSAIAAGDRHSMALTSDGQVFCWGANTTGQLGNGTIVSSALPVAVVTSGTLAGKTIAKIASYGDFSAALSTDGRVFTWGQNQNGGLGNGSTNNSSVPVAVLTNGVLAGKTVTSIACGEFHMVAATSDGQVFGWGNGNYYQLGNGSGAATNMAPVAVNMTGAMAGRFVASVGAGYYHSMALTAEGDAFAWGYNAVGQIGNGGSAALPGSPRVHHAHWAMAGKTLSSLTAGFYSSYLLATDGSVFSTGQHLRATGTGNSRGRKRLCWRWRLRASRRLSPVRGTMRWRSPPVGKCTPPGTTSAVRSATAPRSVLRLRWPCRRRVLATRRSARFLGVPGIRWLG
jgi:alpha-tubulin suppressor-like RCC1 family protein